MHLWFLSMEHKALSAISNRKPACRLTAIGSMTFKTFIGKNGPDMKIVTNRFRNAGIIVAFIIKAGNDTCYNNNDRNYAS